MATEQRRAAKEHMIALMQAGHRGPGGFRPSRDPGQSFDGLSVVAPCAHPWESCLPGWQTRAPCQTAHRRAGLAGSLLSHVTRHSQPCRANSLPGTIRHPDQYRLFEPGPCKTWPGKPLPRGREKNEIRPFLVNPSGKRAQGGCSWLGQPRRLACSPLWKPPCLRVLLVEIRAWRIFQRDLVTCWCEPCSFSGRSDWIAPGICAATRVMGWACSRADLGLMDISTPNASSHSLLKRTEQTPSRMGSHSGQRACGPHQPLQQKRWNLSTTSMGTASLSTLTR